VKDCPLATRVRAALLALATIVAFLTTEAIARPLPRSQDVILAPGLLGLIVLIALFQSLSTNPGRRLMISLAGALGVAASLTLGTLFGGTVVVLAPLADGLHVRRARLETAINAPRRRFSAL
jgi:hypothetical protein